MRLVYVVCVPQDRPVAMPRWSYGYSSWDGQDDGLHGNPWSAKRVVQLQSRNIRLDHVDRIGSEWRLLVIHP
ncbi:hypothetical protein OUZ56_024031 [Daphnia magna]|uniref:Uncharacterized protein n=1 Tax=Daphnia magna TaxID=35525 RepID=A0ABR0B003_9CRUS|nr:hypothetical protein OUZ56_024031 [Daphnia magna]